MRASLRTLLPLAVAALPLALTPAAHAESGTSYSARLDSINGSGGSGMLTLTVHGQQATIHESWSGLAASFNGADYPHVQHIHIGAQGQCPTQSADKNNDGVISTTEGAGAYGGIGTTLSVKGDTSPAAGTNIKIAPAGSSTEYHRTITLSQDTVNALRASTGVVVVHGLDPATLSKKAQNEKSDLVPSLPLAATSPALCGALSSMPSGGVATGTGSTGGIEHLGLLAGGGSLLAAGGVLFATRRRHSANVG
jgi:LPXTG-motif cell wall-anchored protein